MCADLPLVPELQWHPVAAHPAGSSALAPRARHATLVLPALQPGHCGRQHALQAAGSAAAVAGREDAAPLCDDGGVLARLVVFGGVGAQDAWLSDVVLLALTAEDASSSSCSVEVVQLHHGSPLLVPVRDCAACECGPSAFVVVGGFDSSEQCSMRLQLCEVHCQSQASTGSSAGRGWCVSWSEVAPRNRAPLGRCHHSACWHAGSSSVVLFGGWCSGRGCLADVQVFHMQHRQFWQPPHSGAAHMRGTALGPAPACCWAGAC
jgi:hypothetical protein